jgi:hypothetical protein
MRDPRQDMTARRRRGRVRRADCERTGARAMVLTRRVVPLLASLTLITMLVACSVPFTATTTPGSVVTPVPTGASPYRGPLLVQYCTDDTGSYPRAEFHYANALVAHSLVQTVVANSGGTVLYATLINSDTFNSRNTLSPFVVPAVENYPALPTPIPTPPQTNPVSYSATATAVAVQENTGIVAYNSAVAQVNSEVHTTRNQVAQDSNRLIALNPAVDNTATSVWGCLQLARDRFQGQSATKYLFIASDMQNNTSVDFTSDFEKAHALSGVIIRVIYYVCQTAGACSRNATYWTNVFRASGASSIRFLDPAQSNALSNVFGGS